MSDKVLAVHNDIPVVEIDGRKFRKVTNIDWITKADHVLYCTTPFDVGAPYIYQFAKSRSGYTPNAVMEYSDFFKNYFSLCPTSYLTNTTDTEYVAIRLVIMTDADLVLFKTLSVESMS